MKRWVLILLLAGLCIHPLLFSQDTASDASSGNNYSDNGNFYSQLIGFKGGGEFYLSSFKSEWSTGVFFENVMSPWLGLEIEMSRTSVPITNYHTALTNINGVGIEDYIEMGGGLKFYFKGISLGVGCIYNNFVSGYLLDSSIPLTNIYYPISQQDKNFFSIYAGPELTAQISADLFTKVGARFIYGIISDNPNYTMGVRFYISFAYGM